MVGRCSAHEACYFREALVSAGHFTGRFGWESAKAEAGQCRQCDCLINLHYESTIHLGLE